MCVCEREGGRREGRRGAERKGNHCEVHAYTRTLLCSESHSFSPSLSHTHTHLFSHLHVIWVMALDPGESSSTTGMQEETPLSLHPLPRRVTLTRLALAPTTQPTKSTSPQDSHNERVTCPIVGKHMAISIDAACKVNAWKECDKEPRGYRIGYLKRVWKEITRGTDGVKVGTGKKVWKEQYTQGVR